MDEHGWNKRTRVRCTRCNREVTAEKAWLGNGGWLCPRCRQGLETCVTFHRRDPNLRSR